MSTLNGFTRPADPIGPDLASKIAAAIGKQVDTANVSPTDVIVSGPSLVAGDKAAIQTVLNSYVNDPSWGLTLKLAFTLNGIPSAVWTNQPAALTELPNSRFKVPLYGCSYARFCTNVAVAGAAGALLMVRLSLDNGATWSAVGASPQVVIDAPGFKMSSLVAVPANFQTEVLGAVWGQGGNAVADPAFGLSMVGAF